MTDSVTIEYPLGDNPPSANLLYGIDVIEGLKRIPDKHVQTVCTSPPYWGLRDYGVTGQIGLEKTPQEFVANLVAVFREIRRVLRDDGTVWLNLGDSYNSGRDGGHPGGKASGFQQVDGRYQNRSGANAPGLKPKDLVGIPWRVAFALQEDGWYLRSDIIWAKSTVMPESIRDRPTKAHEYVFLLTKNVQYFYDQEAIRETSSWGRENNPDWQHQRASRNEQKGCGNRNAKDGGFSQWNTSRGRNKRTVWNINPKPYKGAHFAVWPEALVEPMILAGTSEKGCCSTCGAPLKRVIQRNNPSLAHADSDDRGWSNTHQKTSNPQSSKSLHRGEGGVYSSAVTVGWGPTCKCDAHTTPCTVLDPFSGSATTGLVAMKNGRNYIGIDLNGDYLDLARSRLQGRPAPEKPDEDDQTDVMEFLT